MKFAVAAISMAHLARIAALTALSLGMVSATAEVGRAQSVVDAFMAWQRMKCSGSASCLANAYKIERRGKKYAVSGGEFSTIARTIVDGANGYLMIDDEGTGGGNGVTEAVVFRPASDSALFVVATRVYETVHVQNGTIDVYHWDNGTLNPAPEMFSGPEPRDFVPGADTSRATGFSRSEDVWNETVFYLPRKGRTIDAYLLRFDVERCVKDDWMGQPEAARAVVCAAAAKEYRPNMTMIFDNVEGRVQHGSLSKKKAPALR
ncbi:MAG: hypothetical protein KIT48_04800 [Pseudolabrys sp.]|nr:hypothetical protein [Pseudolabrys sp.]